ncbi:hypothetical protein J6590_076059 [Homalodisca vitripennis]|nr:hypothetical protein J6590_076059 [Homalodisca vitripennis]
MENSDFMDFLGLGKMLKVLTVRSDDNGAKLNWPTMPKQLYKKNQPMLSGEKYADLIGLCAGSTPIIKGEENEDTASLLSMDVEGRVIRAESFSKILSSGLRVGFVTGPSHLIRQIELHIQVSTLHTAGVPQVIVSKLLKSWDHEGYLQHIEQVKKFYRERRDLMVAACNRYLKDVAEWNVPTGGMFLWVKVPVLKDTWSLAIKHCMEKHLIVVPGHPFTAGLTPPQYNYIRLSFSLASPEQMDKSLVQSERKVNYTSMYRIVRKYPPSMKKTFPVENINQTCLPVSIPYPDIGVEEELLDFYGGDITDLDYEPFDKSDESQNSNESFDGSFEHYLGCSVGLKVQVGRMIGGYVSGSSASGRTMTSKPMSGGSTYNHTTMTSTLMSDRPITSTPMSDRPMSIGPSRDGSSLTSRLSGNVIPLSGRLAGHSELEIKVYRCNKNGIP